MEDTQKVSTEPGVSKFGLWRTLDYQCTSARARRRQFWVIAHKLSILSIFRFSFRRHLLFLPDGVHPLSTALAGGFCRHMLGSIVAIVIDVSTGPSIGHIGVIAVMFYDVNAHPQQGHHQQHDIKSQFLIHIRSPPLSHRYSHS